MAKYRVYWWERNWWEVIVEAESEEEAKGKVDEWTDEVVENMRETDDSFIDRSDLEVEEYDEEIQPEDCFDDPRRDPAINDSIEDMEEEDKAFPPDKE